MTEGDDKTEVIVLRSMVTLTVALMCLQWHGEIASAHPGRGIVSTRDGSVYFADAGRSVVWKCTPDGSLIAAGPGVHAHWLALDPSGTSVYADHLRYDTETQRFSQGLVRLSVKENSDTVEDVIPPEEHPGGLSSGSYLIESGDRIVRVADGESVRLVLGPLASPDEQRDRVIGVLDGADPVGGLASGGGDRYILTVGGGVRSMDRDGVERVVASAEALGRAAPRDSSAHEPMYGDRLWGLCVLSDGSVLACDPSWRRILRIGADGAVSVWYTAPAPWSPVGVATRGEDVVILEAGFIPASRNLGPRVVLMTPDGSFRTLAEVAENEPSRPYR